MSEFSNLNSTDDFLNSLIGKSLDGFWDRIWILVGVCFLLSMFAILGFMIFFCSCVYVGHIESLPKPSKKLRIY